MMQTGAPAGENREVRWILIHKQRGPATVCRKINALCHWELTWEGTIKQPVSQETCLFVLKSPRGKGEKP
jgi:hypothetical protein